MKGVKEEKEKDEVRWSWRGKEEGVRILNEGEKMM